MIPKPAPSLPSLAGSTPRALSFLLILVLPILFLSWAVDRAFLEQEGEVVTRQAETLDRHLALALFSSSVKERFARAFSSFFRRLSRRGFRKDSYDGSRFPFPAILDSRVAFFSTDGELQLVPGVNLESRYAISRLWEELVSGEQVSRFGLLYQEIFGKRFSVDLIKRRPGIPIEIGPGNGDGYLIWKRGKGKSGLLAYFPRLPDAFENLADFLRGLERVRPGIDSSGLATPRGVWALVEPATRRWMALGGIGWRNWRGPLLQACRSGQTLFTANDKLCRVIRLPEGIWMLRALPRADDRIRVFRESFLALAAVIFLIGWGVWQTGAWFRLSGSPLSFRLSLLFSVAVLIPSGLLFALGVSSFREHSAVLAQEAHDRNLARLEGLDDEVRWRYERMLAFCREIRDHLAKKTGDASFTEKLFKRAVTADRIFYLETRDRDSRIISQCPRDDALLVYGGIVCSLAMERYLGIAPTGTLSPLESMARSVYSSHRLGFADVLDHPDTLNPITVGKERNLSYWDFLSPSPGRKTAYLMTVQSRESDKVQFLNRRLASDVFAFDQSLVRWFPKSPPVPGLKKLVAQALAGDRSLNGRVEFEGRSLLVSVFPSAALPDVGFLTWCDLGPIDAAIGQARLLFWGSAGFALVLALLIARITSGALLKPIREITSGIQALEAGRLTFRLPNLGQDEFGRLGQAFNALLAERQDLDMARALQQRIIPARPPVLPGYRIAFWYQSMTEVGGDYLDLFPLPDHRLLFVVADVTGHGVSAALMTTMAKTVSMASARKDDGLPRFLDRMNAMVMSVVKKKKIMTLVAGILDWKSHCLTWASAGHPYPLFRPRGAPPHFLESVQYPIGLRRKVDWKVNTQSFAPGDSFLAYTDGITEAVNPGKKMLGFGGLLEAVGKAPGQAPEAIIETCCRRVEEHLAGQPKTDDVTILAISRTD